MTNKEPKELITALSDNIQAVAEMALAHEKQATALKLELVKIQQEIQLLKIKLRNI